MRFSLKWVLVGMAYAAVAAAAFSQTTWVYADVLWTLSLLAVVYAGLIATFARGQRQMAAAGFVAASVVFSLCVFAGSGSVPTLRLLTAAGIGAQSEQPMPMPPYYAPQPVITTRRPVTIERMTPNGPVKSVTYVQEARVAPTPTLAAPLPATPFAAPMVVDFSMYIRAGNAVGMMLFGGLGCVLGLIAYKAARRELGAAQQIAPGQ
jgi:hypothetical protein